jgi:predicted phosphodiesterase
MSHTRIGILSDTHLGGHQKLWDEIGVAFEGVDLILHSGDVSYPSVLDRCEEWAPVLCCLGNHDEGVHHDPRVKPMQLPDIFICGDSHYERMDFREGVLQVNSGSAVLPHNYSQRLGTVAILDLEPGQLRAKIIKLGETPGLVNPGIEFFFDGTTVYPPPESAGRYMVS